MDSGELIELFYNRTYEKFVNKQILDDKNYIVPRQQLTNYVHELVNIPFIEFIDYIKHHEIDRYIDYSDITQFSSFSTCEVEMCKALQWANNPGCQYVDIGKFFPNKLISRSESAYRRYGEIHVKASTQLGLTFEYYNYWYLSCLGYIYPELEKNLRMQLLVRTITRNRLYQQLLIDILDHDVNPEVYINILPNYNFKRCQRSVCYFLNICLDICRKEGIKVHNLIRRYESPEEIIQDDDPIETNERIYKYILEIGRQELLFPEEEVELAQKTRRGDVNARNKLVRANMRFVVGLAKQYLHKGLEFEDLLQEGFLGLIKAAELFDETRGFKLIKYAPWWIRRYLSNAIITDSTLIRYPMNVRILHKRVKDFKIRYENQYGFMPPVSEIDIGDVDNYEIISFLYSLPNNLKNTCVPYENMHVLEDNHNDIWDYEDNEYNKKYVKTLLSHLSPREQDVLRKFYGIDVREETLESIGEYHGLTRERARQIKEKAVRKLRDIKDSVLKKISETELRIIHFDEEVETKATKDVKGTSVIKEIYEQIFPNSTNNNIPNLSFNKTNQTSTDNDEKGIVASEPAYHPDALNVEDFNNASSDGSIIDKENISLSTEKIYDVFNNTVSTYKYFWFISILQILKKERKAKIYIYNITARMVANAWRQITCYRLSFGSFDSLHKITHELQLLTGISNVAQIETIYNIISTRLDEAQIKQQLQILTKNVPYRFLTPWTGSVSNEGGHESECFYSIIGDDDNPFMTINPLWSDYIEKNYDKLIDFSYQKLASFLQKRNPNVEDILSKLKSPIIIKCNNMFHRYTIVNTENQCGIFDDYGVQVYSSAGRIKQVRSLFFNINYTYTFLTVNQICINEEDEFTTGKRIVMAKYRSPLYKIIDERNYMAQIEDLNSDGENRVKVNGNWYDENGRELYVSNKLTPDYREP